MANSASVILDLGEGMRFSGISPAGSEITLDALRTSAARTPARRRWS